MTKSVLWLGRYRTAKFVALVFVFVCMLIMCRAKLAFAATANGAVISNTATINFSDANSIFLSATSNTITATFQNASSLTVTVGAPQFVSPGMIVVDTFVLTNTSSVNGSFVFPGDATFGGAAPNIVLLGYVLNSLQVGTCSVGTPCPYAILNTQSGMAVGAVNGSINVGVEYTVPIGAILTQTVQTTLTVTVSYASMSVGSSETSPPVSATASDTVKSDARLDVQASATTSINPNPTITWTITANNGGGFPAQGLKSAAALMGASTNGIAIFLPMPSFSGTYLQLQAPPQIPILGNQTPGTAAVWYYNPAPCSVSPTTLWTTQYSAIAECLAVYISNSNIATANLLPSAPTQSTGAAGVTTPQVTISFITNQPSGSLNSVTLIASSAIGGNAWATGVVPITGQGIIPGLPSEFDAANAGLLNAIQANVTSSNGVNPPGGASNQAVSQGYMPAPFALLNGPYGAPGATGGGWTLASGTATASVDGMHDFTAYGVPCTSNAGVGVNGSPCSVRPNTVIVNTVQNTGTQDDTILLTATAHAGWTVQLFNVGTCSGGGAVWPTCTQGTQISPASTDGSSTSGSVFVPAAAPLLNYEAVYNATGNSATPFKAYYMKITAAGQSGSGTGTDTNDTYNTLFAGSVIVETTAVAPVANCPTGVVAVNQGVCPGGTLRYSIAYANVVPAGVAANPNLSGEPAFAYSALYGNAALITDDGMLSPNTWATYTSGIAAAATDTTPGTIFTYYPSGSTTFVAGQTKLTAQIGGAAGILAPGASGTVTFTVIVK